MELPDYFGAVQPEAASMTYAELSDYIDVMRGAGHNILQYLVDLHRKIAFPFVTIIMSLLAVPFAVSTGRRGTLYGIGIGIVLAIVYWTANNLFGVVGATGLLVARAGGVGSESAVRRRRRLHDPHRPDVTSRAGLVGSTCLSIALQREACGGISECLRSSTYEWSRIAVYEALRSAADRPGHLSTSQLILQLISGPKRSRIPARRNARRPR